jgi:hypothetical protein
MQQEKGRRNDGSSKYEIHKEHQLAMRPEQIADGFRRQSDGVAAAHPILTFSHLEFASYDFEVCRTVAT